MDINDLKQRLNQYDLKGLAALELLRRKVDSDEEKELCFCEIVDSVKSEETLYTTLIEESISSIDLVFAEEALLSDIEWKTRLIDEFRYEIDREWSQAAFALWSLRPWLGSILNP